MDNQDFPNFRAFFNKLARAASSRGIPDADSEDLSAEAIERALGSFDPAKGSFQPYCNVVLANLMKNYWQRKKKTEEYTDPEGPVDPASAIDGLELQETIREYSIAVSEIKKLLLPEEKTFLEHLQHVLDERVSGAISEAARRAGITPAKGWDLFRKVQRKVRKSSMARAQSVSHTISDNVTNLYGEQIGPRFSLGSRDLLERFSRQQLYKLELLLMES